MKERDLELQFRGYRLTTAEIIYWLPDHPNILQSFVWQQLDLAPQFPALTRFIDFWHSSLDGRIHSVRVGASEIIAPARTEFVDHEMALH